MKELNVGNYVRKQTCSQESQECYKAVHTIHQVVPLWGTHMYNKLMEMPMAAQFNSVRTLLASLGDWLISHRISTTAEKNAIVLL